VPSRIRLGSQWLLSRIEKGFNTFFTPAWNPFYHLGALTIFFFWVVLVTGIYVFVFFSTSVTGAYPSVEYLTHDQWYLGGVMRSLHRYASDAAIVTIGLHIAKEFIMDRHRGVRWFSWFTGVPLLWMVFPLGITGYWLVWDQLAQYVAVASSELLDVLPIFSEPMARNFLTNASVSDRFFTLMAFLHLLGLPIFLLFGIWFHLLRISRPKVNPPLGLAIGTLAALTVLALVKPAISMGPADLGVEPVRLGFDWFYLIAYPLLDRGSPTLVWVVLLGSSTLVSLAPWLPPLRRKPAAVVSLPNCNGCGRCVADCPYNAVSLQPRTDGLAYEAEAVVTPELCTACGICAGACPTSTPLRRKSELVPGIDLPGLPIRTLRDWTLAAAVQLASESRARVLVYACAAGVNLTALRNNGVAVVELRCLAQLPPAFIDFVISRRHADGVLLLGCRQNDCHFRLGVQWTDERLAGKRDPYLRGRVPRERVATCWGGQATRAETMQAIEAFRARLGQLGPYQRESPAGGGS
jgi:quinol-cytochrome oxidoreductase complex cytochrome b subunit/coenzyme F420-reducing hydrogenase delta subunit/Pyruvate/2-oxoacid:ferredoxin oxidoreductase delta subunit